MDFKYKYLKYKQKYSQEKLSNRMIGGNDNELVLAEVSKDGFKLRDASKEQQANPEIVSAAVKQNGLALKFASNELKRDRTIVCGAVKNTGLALKYADEA
jgi:lambda repressor-like predicted transcriptional regulator